MMHTLKIIILSVIQVFSTPGCGGYLCVDKDGTLSGFHGRAEQCGCCCSPAEFAEFPDEHQQCGHQHDNKCCAIGGDFIPEEFDATNDVTASPGMLPKESLPCSCVHIPVNAPTAKVERAVRLSHLLLRCRQFSQRDSDCLTLVLAPGNPAVTGLSNQGPHFALLRQHNCVILRL